ncbi:MAG: hypothetical protein JWL86_2146 [Rhizobium sp.]|nr:hypothetical protein [Rhizobium sp.]
MWREMLEGPQMADVLRIPIVSAAEAEECAFLVCVRKGAFSPFTDNAEGRCSVCNHVVVFRPTSPAKPPRLCLECAAEMATATKQ